jgi:hypothetical protein
MDRKEIGSGIHHLKCLSPWPTLFGGNAELSLLWKGCVSDQGPVGDEGTRKPTQIVKENQNFETDSVETLDFAKLS